MTAPRCVHDVARQSCVTCAEATVPAGHTRVRRPSRVFVAAFESVCAKCSFDVREGDLARFVRDRLVHAGCGEDL